MRLFQSQVFYDENRSPPPPPHFSLDRESTRMMPVYLSRYRDGRHRLPTPEKVAVMELSASFERRRLGKHQQILTDISQRCREQEVSDLSNQLSAKVNLRTLERQGKEVTFYSTTFMGNKNKRNSNFEGIESPKTQVDLVTITSKPNLEKSYKHFPVRRIMKQHTKFDFIKQTNTPFPRLTHHLARPTNESGAPRYQLAEKQIINGPIQLSHYVSPRTELAPLVLPTVPGHNSGQPAEHLDRMDTCFSTKCVTLGPRTKTNLTQGSKSGHTARSGYMKDVKGMDFGREMSQLHLQNVDGGGHSPPPNSEQELLDGANTV